MLYSLAKSTISHFNPGMVSRTLREVRLGSLKIFVFNYLAQEYNIEKQNRKGIIYPTVMHVELTTYCPRRCKDCYLPIEERKDKKVIDLETAHESVQKGTSWRIRVYDLVGGETISSDSTPIIENMITKHPSLSFYCCTNGDYLSSENEKLDNIVLRNNFSVGLSIDGFKETNDALRGKNSYSNIVSAAEYLRSRKSFYGAVVTLRPENIEEATSEEFIDFLIKKGFNFLFYSISYKISNSSCYDALKTLNSLRRKPLFIYNSLVGHIDDSSPKKLVRDIYVDKHGNILNSRRKRILIADITQDLDTIVLNEDWQKRFTLE